MIAEQVEIRDDIIRSVRPRGTLRPKPATVSAVGYGRITKFSKTKLATQRQRVEEYCAMFLPGVPVDAWYEDNCKTRIRSDNREGYQQAVAELLAGKRSHLITFMLERWSGDDVGMTTFIRGLWAQGIEVHDTVRGKITEENLPLLAQFARLEIKTNSQRGQSKQRANAEEGYKLGRPPLGYEWVELRRYVDDEGKEHIKSDRGRTQPDQPAFGVMQQVFRRAADESIPLVRTRAWMNQQLGTAKDERSFLRLLTNPYYAGLAIQLREDCACLNMDYRTGAIGRHYARPEEQWITTEHPHPVCAPEVFAAVQRRLERGRTVGRTVEHAVNPLSGLVRCAVHPQRRMRLQYTHGGYVNYRCRICVPYHGRSVPKIQAALAAALVEAVDVRSNPDHVVMTRLTTMETARRAIETKIEQHKAHLRAIGRERGQATRNLNAGLITTADYAAAMADAEDEQNALRSELRNMERALTSMGQGPDLGSLGHDVAQVRAWCMTGTDAEPAAIKRALTYVVNRIVLDPAEPVIRIEWSPDMAVIMGKEAMTVPCATGRHRLCTCGAVRS